MDLREYFSQTGGVVSTQQLAAFFGVSPSTVRNWALQNNVPMIGNAYAFTFDAATSFAAEVLDDEDEEDEDEEDDDGDEDDDDDDADDGDDDEDGDDGDDGDDEDE